MRLSGGNMSHPVRVGDVVHRDAGPWTPTVHRLLEHLHARGVTWVPRPVGMSDGREVITYLDGTVPRDPMPDWTRTDAALVAAARRLAAVHRATADFYRRGAVWQLPAHEPPEVVCHNDFAPYNLVFDGRHRLIGVIDWDTASPGPRLWDLGYLAYRMVPLGRDPMPIAERRRRLRLLCDAYGPEATSEATAPAALDRVRDMAEFTAARAAAGNTAVAGHVQHYVDDAAWLAAHLPDLA